MKINELIETLNKVAKDHPDMDVVIVNYDEDRSSFCICDLVHEDIGYTVVDKQIKLAIGGEQRGDTLAYLRALIKKLV